MMYLNVFSEKLLEIAKFSGCIKLSPAISLVLGWILLIDQLLQGRHPYVMRRIEEEWNRKPFLLRIDSHPVLHTFILIIAPNLWKNTRISTDIRILCVTSETIDPDSVIARSYDYVARIKFCLIMNFLFP